MKATEPGFPRAEESKPIRRALVAIAVSLTVALAVATPAALRLDDADGSDEPATTVEVPRSPASSETTVPTRVLGTSETRDGP